MEIREITFSFLCHPKYRLASHKPYCNGMYVLYIFYMHFTLIVSVFMLSICDTEINNSINQTRL